LPPESLLGVDDACDAFESQWKQGRRPSIEEFLGVVAGPARSMLLQELIRTEMEWRCRSGDIPTANEYAVRFPACAADVETWLAEAGEAAHLFDRGDHGVSPDKGPTRRTDPGTERDSKASTMNVVSAGLAGEAAHPRLPRRLGAYEILERLGQGGMGEVYRARHVHLDRPCALKMIAAAAQADAELLARFRTEALAAGRLEHPNLVRATDAGEAEGTWFLAMELLEGEDLARRTRRLGRWPAGEACEAIRQAALGLQHAHERGLVHRDVKPANLFRTNDGVIKVLDLGLARLHAGRPAAAEGTSVGSFLGTADYAAPEQFVDASAARATADIYSLGCALFHLLTGSPPFGDTTHPTVVSKAAAHLSDAPPDLRALQPDLPGGLERVVARMLAKKPEDRPQSAGEVATALEPFTENLRGSGPPTGSGPSAPTGRRRLRRLVVASGVVIGLLGIAAGSAAWLAERWRSPSESGRPAPLVTQADERSGRVSFKGWIDLRIFAKGDGRQNLRLADVGALPLRPGDQFRIEAAVAPAGYLYVLALDTEGKTDPVFPWQPGRWGTRPAEEQPLDRLSLPHTATRGYTVTGSEEGMQSVVLLVRSTPLDCSDEELQHALAGMPAQRPLAGRSAVAWFEDGREVRSESGRQRTGWEESDVASPTLRLQQLFAERLRKYADYSRAVLYAKVGK
jgi:serine/threonine protein kinase